MAANTKPYYHEKPYVGEEENIKMNGSARRYYPFCVHNVCLISLFSSLLFLCLCLFLFYPPHTDPTYGRPAVVMSNVEGAGAGAIRTMLSEEYKSLMVYQEHAVESLPELQRFVPYVHSSAQSLP